MDFNTRINYPYPRQDSISNNRRVPESGVPYLGNGVMPDNTFRQGNIPLPFYMTYPGYLGSSDGERAALRDLEYLQQTYPAEVKRYQRKVAQILDKMDYEGSMIYDEYPDRYTMQRMARSILQVIKEEERASLEENGTVEVNPQMRMDMERNWNWLEGMIHVLLCGEIYKRRHGGRRDLGYRFL